MLTLAGKISRPRNLDAETGRIIVRVTDEQSRVKPLREKEAFLVRSSAPPDGFGLYLAIARDAALLDGLASTARSFVLPNSFDYLADGDIVRIWPRKLELRTLYRRGAPFNSFLVTERCNHYCLMCSQPPKDVDDGWIVDDIVAAIKIVDPSASEICLTGGEPTLLGDDFLRILRVSKSYLPRTAVHVLSNGRRFVEMDFVRAYADTRHPDIMIGIPIYSDLSNVHDYVVQAAGAFDETIRGILNLGRLRQRVELRVVIHQQTYERLPQLAEFIARNLTFVDQIALMGLEITGFTKANLKDLWIDPMDYREQLYRAVMILVGHQMNVSIYNHQLCLLDHRLWRFARKSISDWKNDYMAECRACTQRDACGGFFTSAAIKHSDHIKAFC